MIAAMGTTTLISFAEFERLEEGPDQIELLKGELIQMPAPQREHMDVCHRLYDPLKAAVTRLKETEQNVLLGNVYIEMGYLLSGEPRSWLRPDVSLTHRQQPGDRYYEGAPLMVFEVVSESDSARGLEGKVAAYLADGAEAVWVIYPTTRNAWVYERSSRSARCETRSIHSQLLPGIEILLDDIL